MKIIEVRDGFIKYEADRNIYPSAFIQANGENKSYLAQVVQVKNIGEVYVASAKMLFVFDGENLREYDKTQPPVDAEIEEVTENIIRQSIKYNTPVVIGKTFDDKHNIPIDISSFDKKMLICIDNTDNLNIILKNLSLQFNHLNKKTLIIDTLGNVKSKKYVAGRDFKLPLNKVTLEFLYKECLNEATSDSKSIIVEIFKDLAEYSETVPFVPFGTLKSIIDNMVNKEHVFKLLVLKNILAKLEKQGFFATTQKDVNALDEIINQNVSVIDISGLNPAFQNRFIGLIYETLNKYDDVQVLFEVSNTVTKKSLKEILTENKTPTTLIANSGFKYISDIKTLFDNFIIEANSKTLNIFGVYSNILSSVFGNGYLTAGEATNYIPLASKFQHITDFEQDLEDLIDENVSVENSEEVVSEEILDVEEEENSVISEEDDAEIYEEVEFSNNNQEDLINSIEQHSDTVIDNISEEVENSENIENLFDDSEEDYSEEEIEQGDEMIDSEDDEFSESEELLSEDLLEEAEDSSVITDENSNIIEPEFKELGDSEEDKNEIPYAEEPEEDDDEESSLDNVDEINDDLTAESEPEELETQEDELSLEQDDSEIELSENDDITSSFDEFEESSESLLVKDNSDSDDSDIDTLIEQEDDSQDLSIEIDDGIDLDLAEDQSDADLTEETEESVVETEVIPLNNDYDNEDGLLDEIIELDPSEADQDDIIVDMSEDEDIVISDDTEQEIMDDVDKVYTTVKENTEDEISDSDLDFIDELSGNDDGMLEDNSEDDNFLEELSDTSDEGILEEVHEEDPVLESHEPEILEKRDSSTPIVPVYDADIPQEDLVVSDPIQQGDAVVHAKYGSGVVEKMIKYGNKTLFSINFDNIGRRLLDPTLTEIKKV